MSGREKRPRLRSATLLLATLGLGASCAPRENGGSAPSDGVSSSERLQRSLPSAPLRRWFDRPLDASDVKEPGDGFGSAVGISGTSAVVAAPGGAAAYVFVRANDGWHEQAKLEPPPDAGGRTFGSSIAISGDTVIVGAVRTDAYGSVHGAAYVYERSGTMWRASSTLLADDGIPIHEFGRSVAVEGDLAVVGAPLADGSREANGAVYVFERSESIWLQTKKLFSRDASTTDFGRAVALSGSNVLVGAPTSPNGTWDGQAHVFTLSGASWSEQILTIPVFTEQQEFGDSVALDGNVAVVGANHHGGRDAATRPGFLEGAAFAFRKSTSGWNHALDLYAYDGAPGDRFGTAVGVSNDTVMVGAPGGTGIDSANSVYVFDVLRGSDVTERLGMRRERAYFGGSLALDGEIAVVGTTDGQNGAYVVELLVPNGGPCAEDLDCENRHCIAGICCNQACSGRCQRCTSGTCELTPLEPGTPTCAPYLCSEAGGDCPEGCRAHADCIDTFYCSDGLCEPRLQNGEACEFARACLSGQCIDDVCAGSRRNGARCSNASECGSGHCVDGFCCDRICDQQCEACDLTEAPGSCLPVTGEPHGDRPACDAAGAPCGGRCDGSRRTRCTYPTGSEICGSVCLDDRETKSVCNGRAECVKTEPLPCWPYVCADESRCETTCTDSTDCAEGLTCSGGECEPGTRCLDERTEERPSGAIRNCSPYVCADRSCKEWCVDSRDCTPENACKNGGCVPAPPKTVTTTDDGCGCRVVRPRARDGRWLAFVVFVVVAARARRRAPRVERFAASGLLSKRFQFDGKAGHDLA